VRRLLPLLMLYRPIFGWMALGVFLSLMTVLANVTLMAVSGWFITSMAIAGAAQVSMNYFTPAAIIRGAAIVRTGGRYAERLVTHEATLQLLARLRAWFYEKLEPLAPAALDQHHSGDLLSRIRADVDTLDHLYLRLLVPVLTAALAVTILTAFLATYDAALAAVLFGLLVTAGVFVPMIMTRLGRQPGARSVVLKAEQRSLLVDSTQGLGELLLYGATDVNRTRVADSSAALAVEQAKLAAANGLGQASMLLLANLAMWWVLWLAIPMVGDGQLAKADLAMLALFCLAAFEAVMPLPMAFRAYGETLAAAQRLFEMVDLEVPVRPPEQPMVSQGAVDIRMENVGFSYPGARQRALAGLSLELPYGKRVVVRGPSGSGKSSIVQLLLRFYDPQDGHIRLGGIELKDWDIEQLRRQLAVVEQKPHLFTGTVRDNLLLARPDANTEAMRQACVTAQFHDVIEALPDGYDTWLGEAGATLSGGEARRLSIARAVLKDSPILILDEPTEGLDATTAAQLMASIDRASVGKTVLVITHQQLHGMRFDAELDLREGRAV
jgi:ATP-binding cassette subfamily C protein CydC